MKHLFFFLLVLSCSPEGAVNHQTTVPSVPEKIEKPQKPELPPEGCACIKIFRPVCAEGRTFGNSCEAQCHGHEDWTEGSCK